MVYQGKPKFLKYMFGKSRVILTMVWCGVISVISCSSAQAQNQNTEKYIKKLEEQGIRRSQIIGVDANGIPLMDRKANKITTPTSLNKSTTNSFPDGLRAYEAIPGVVRNDGKETFRLEVELTQEVNEVQLTDELTNSDGKHNFIGPTSYPITLKDDGQGSDREAGDQIYTAGPFHYNTDVQMSSNYGDYTERKSDSPEGIDFMQLGTIKIETPGGETEEFIVPPQIGVLRKDITAAETQKVAKDVQVASHFINIKTQKRNIQGSMHASYELREENNYTLGGMKKRIYELFPDVFQILNFVSTNRVETRPSNNFYNFYAGLHGTVNEYYTGTGINYRGKSAYSDKLMGYSQLDMGTRGFNGVLATHELMHQWAAYLDTDLGITTEDNHYLPRSSAASPLYGDRWLKQGDQKFTLYCPRGHAEVVGAPPLDLYLMGLIPGDEVPPIYVAKDTVFFNDYCEPPEDYENPTPPDTLTSAHIKRVVTIDEIQDYEGVRKPGPKQSRKDYHIAYIGESTNRLMNDTEMTFYNILTKYRAKDTPDINYQAGINWTPLQGYFKHGSSWETKIPSVEQKKPHSVDSLSLETVDGSINISWKKDLTNLPTQYIINKGKSVSQMEPVDTVDASTTTYQASAEETAFYSVQSMNKYGNTSPKKPVVSYLNESRTFSPNRFHLLSNPLDTAKNIGSQADIYRYWLYYRNSGYLETTETGYWYNSDVEKTIHFKGKGVVRDAVYIYEGWNLIGGLADTVKIASILDPGKVLDMAPIYTYDPKTQKYVEPTVMTPFSAYWVYGGPRNNDGNFDSQRIIRDITRKSEEGVYRLKKRKSTDKNLDQVVFSSQGVTKRLFFSSQTLSDKQRYKYLLPPQAPGTALDVRTTDGYKIADNRSVEIKIDARQYPVKVGLDKSRGSNNGYKIVGKNDGDSEVEFRLQAGRKVELPQDYDHLYVKRTEALQRPNRYSLGSNYPNPFNPTTSIQYQVPEPADVVVEVYNVLGERTKTLVDDHKKPGRYTIHFDGSGLASGVYILKFKAGDFVDTQKMTLIK